MTVPTRPANQTERERVHEPGIQSEYVPPTLVRLGTLSEVTLGGDVGFDPDAHGTAGQLGNLS